MKLFDRLKDWFVTHHHAGDTYDVMPDPEAKIDNSYDRGRVFLYINYNLTRRYSELYKAEMNLLRAWWHARYMARSEFAQLTEGEVSILQNFVLMVLQTVDRPSVEFQNLSIIYNELKHARSKGEVNV